MKTHHSNIRYKNWQISLGWYCDIFLSFSWVINSYMMHFDQLLMSKTV